MLELALLDSKYVVWYPYIGCWFISILVEILLVILPILRYHPMKPFFIAWVAVAGCRIVLLVSLPTLFCIISWPMSNPPLADSDEEVALLATRQGRTENSHSLYGSFEDSDSDSEADKKMKSKMRAKLQESGNWWTYAKSFAVSYSAFWFLRRSSID